MNSRTIYLLLLFITITINSSGQDYLKELKKANRFKCDKLLCQFLDTWQSKSTHVTDSEIGNYSEAQKDVYEIFQDFYDPFNLKRTGGDSIEVNLDKSTEYLVVQNKIFFYTVNSESLILNFFDRSEQGSFKFDSIMDFRPDLRFPDIRILYLTDDYNGAIDQFLEKKRPSNSSKGKDALIGVPQIEAYSTSRINFLNKRLYIIDKYGSWDLHLVTHLEISSIRFNKSYSLAKVYFRFGHQLGEAIYVKENGNWIILSSILNSWEGSTF